ncbi:hypothetical protein [Ferruginibacter sp. HRS2-29]|uniref:hypothetical protein n=1 Tax=Ferruginibacter sp. HRS2-29 TaxID=2487334 RepID=UPI0020CE1910|nr:hypothetical protein [Ferruginibacter sp. HRS2-29]
MLTNKNINRFAAFYLLCFLLSYAWFFFYGFNFSALQPVYFLNKPDVTGNFFMLTGLQQQLIKHQWMRILMDTLYLLLPCLLVLACFKKSRLQGFLAVATSVFSMLYGYFFTMMCFGSIEGFIAWMLVPLLFISTSTKGFYYLLHGLRILFILFFFTAALWKIRLGGVFNTDQFSGILIYQHANLLAEHPQGWFAAIIRFLVDHPAWSYCLYLAAFLLEFVFVTGLFTCRYDRYLILLFCAFAVADYFLMEIVYFFWLPFMGCFYLSRHVYDPEVERLKEQNQRR